MNRLPSFHISRRFLKVWRRNLIVYAKIWPVNFLPPLLEPLFFLVAFGVGLGAFIETVNYGGKQLSYVAFITPSLLAFNIMNNAFYENTYTSFVRMYYQKTFDALMATPLSMEEVITGEIAWGATKSAIATVLMLAAVAPFKLVAWPWALLLIPLSFLGGFAFGSIAMFFTGITPTIDMFNVPVFLFITPMFLFSGTFFPIDVLPLWGKILAYSLPLTHLVNLCRDICLGSLGMELVWSLAYLICFILIFFPLALASMHRRLIH